MNLNELVLWPRVESIQSSLLYIKYFYNPLPRKFVTLNRRDKDVLGGILSGKTSGSSKSGPEFYNLPLLLGTFPVVVGNHRRVN